MKDKKNKIIYIILLIFFIVVAGFSFYKIVLWKQDGDDNNEIKEEINEYVEINPETNEIDINFTELKNINPDTVGYLMVPGTNINYVVVKSNDNDFYLNHNFNRKNNSGGWVFMDYSNSGSVSDQNIVIYGHNMKNGTMFAGLRKTMNKEWYQNEENHIITYVNETGTYKYKVFSQYMIEAEEYYITTSFNSDEEFKSFVNNVKKRSYNKYDLDIDSTTSILTLSTCSSIGNGRVVLHAALINEE